MEVPAYLPLLFFFLSVEAFLVNMVVMYSSNSSFLVCPCCCHCIKTVIVLQKFCFQILAEDETCFQLWGKNFSLCYFKKKIYFRNFQFFSWFGEIVSAFRAFFFHLKKLKSEPNNVTVNISNFEKCEWWVAEWEIAHGIRFFVRNELKEQDWIFPWIEDRQIFFWGRQIAVAFTFIHSCKNIKYYFKKGFVYGKKKVRVDRSAFFFKLSLNGWHTNCRIQVTYFESPPKMRMLVGYVSNCRPIRHDCVQPRGRFQHQKKSEPPKNEKINSPKFDSCFFLKWGEKHRITKNIVLFIIIHNFWCWGGVNPANHSIFSAPVFNNHAWLRQTAILVLAF